MKRKNTKNVLLDWLRENEPRNSDLIKVISGMNRIIWKDVSRQKLSEGFIREFVDRVDWWCISVYQKLSESFIREFVDRVDWDCIWFYVSNCQKLSEGFIREFKDRVDWDMVSKYQDISDQFTNEFRDRINWELYMEARNKRVKQVLEDFVK